LGAVITPGNRDTTFNGYTLTYDNVGNLTHKSKTGFDQYYYWNSIGQLDSVVTNGARITFLYDGQGRRVAKVTGLDLRYIYSGSQLIAEVDSSNPTHAADIYRYYPGVDNPQSVKAVSGTYFYLSAIGTLGVAAVIDSTGKIKNRYRYNPWGGLEDSVETVSNVLKFAGREYDPETHLYYNRARYYDPQLARFISEDPIGQNGGANQYAYAANNPIGSSDPSGTCVMPGLHDAFHNCGVPRTDATATNGGMATGPSQAWHCDSGADCAQALNAWLASNFNDAVFANNPAWNLLSAEEMENELAITVGTDPIGPNWPLVMKFQDRNPVPELQGCPSLEAQPIFGGGVLPGSGTGPAAIQMTYAGSVWYHFWPSVLTKITRGQATYTFNLTLTAPQMNPPTRTYHSDDVNVQCGSGRWSGVFDLIGPP